MTLTSSAILWRNEKQFAPVANRGEAKVRPVRPAYQNRSTPRHFAEGRTPKNGKQGTQGKKPTADMVAAMLAAGGLLAVCAVTRDEGLRLTAVFGCWACLLYAIFRYRARVRRAQGRKSR